MTKPLLFLDVDGVLNILPGVLKARVSPPSGFLHYSVWAGFNEYRDTCMNPVVGSAVRSLSEEAEIVWLSHWNNAANQIGRVIGMHQHDFVAVPHYLSAAHKVHVLFSHLSWQPKGRRVLWVDDQILADDFEQLSNRLPRFEISALKTDPTVGLRLQDIDLLRDECAN